MNSLNAMSFVGYTCELVGWLLLHTVWQFAVLAGLVLVIDHLLRHQTARARYWTLLSGLLLFPLTPVLTLIWFPHSTATSEPLANANLSSPYWHWDFLHPADPQVSSPDQIAIDATSSVAGSKAADTNACDSELFRSNASRGNFAAQAQIRVWLSVGALIWSCGVMLFSVRFAIGLWHVRKLRLTSSPILPDAIQDLTERLRQRLSIYRSVSFRHSTRIDSPIVLGCLKSVILIPTGILSNMPIEQLEALLVHELVHVRRFDYLFNLLQAWIETLFFYHPAVWWLSARVRHQRECWCDDGVVAMVLDRVTYGNALLAIETLRNQRLFLSVGASHGSLLRRVERLFAPPRVDTKFSFVLPLLGLLVFLACLSQAANGLTPAVSPAGAWLYVTETAPPEGHARNQGGETPAESESGAKQDDRLVSKRENYVQARPTLDLPLALAAADSQLWITYLNSISRIRNLSCAFEIHHHGKFDYTENTADGYYIARKYKSYVWELGTGNFVAEHADFSHVYFPPYDWANYITFHSKHRTGMFHVDQYWGREQDIYRHWMPFAPHPLSFISSGMIGIPDFFDATAWKISEVDQHLVLESIPREYRDAQRVTVELSPEHGMMPKVIEVQTTSMHLNWKVRYIVDRFLEVDGTWLPVEMRVESFRDVGEGMKPDGGPYGKMRVVIDPTTVKVNRELDASIFHFDIPPGSFWTDESTDQRIEGEIGLQRVKEFRNQAKERR